MGLMLFTLTVWSFDFLFMRKPTPAWLLFALILHNRWPLCNVVKHSSRLLTSPILITSDTNLISLSSSSTSCMCLSVSIVLTLYRTIFSLFTLFRCLFLTQRHLVVVDQSRHLGRGRFRWCWSLGDMAL